MAFFNNLENRVKEVNSLLCIGIDPHPDDFSVQSGQGIYNYCINLIEQTIDFTAAYKPNIAFFEALGSDGYDALHKVISHIPDNIPIILDAKRGDISSTAKAYAHSAFNILGAGAITLNPYLGFEAVEPFFSYADKGSFILCKTSNHGAAELQEATLINGEKLYERVAKLAIFWNINKNIGLVVGATYPDAIKRVRTLAQDMWILAPGVGAQGADLDLALDAGLRSDKSGILITVSRSISRAGNPHRAAFEICYQINRKRIEI